MTQYVEVSSSKILNPIASVETLEATASQTQTGIDHNSNLKDELILCQHCLRTASNGIKCRGICVADSNY